MGTTSSNIQVLSDIAGELTKIIKTNSVAYQVCGIQHSISRSPLVFGVKKGSSGTSFEIVSKTPTKVFDTGTTPSTDNFTEELIDDVFAIFSENAVDMLKQIAANDIADALDVTILDYMYLLSTKKSDVVYDFTDATISHSAHIHSLILKINKERMTISKSLKRGLPKTLIVSPGVAALLITNKMISGNDSDYVAGDKENTKFIGKLADMQVYMLDQTDLTISGEYVIISHKSFLPGDAGMIIIPIAGPKSHLTRDKETGQPNLHFTQKYAYSQNPLDSVPVETALTDAVFTASDDSINSATGGLDLLYAVGDNIEVKDANTAANNGNYVVESVPSENKIIVVGDVITGDTANTATLVKYNSTFISSFGLTLTGFSV